MLKIIVPGGEMYDDASEKFTAIADVQLELEHSLVALSKWESIFEKPFLDSKPKSAEELLEYIKCMVLTPEVPEDVFARFSRENFADIDTYINRKMTATRVREAPGPRSSETISSELIYYWMTVLNIPLEWENRHLSQLFMLIKVADAKSRQPKKMGAGEAAAQQRDLNRRRRESLKTTG